MGVKDKLLGTTRTDFQIGPEATHGVRHEGDEIALYDPVSGPVKLSEMGGGAGGGVGWRHIANSQTRTIANNYTHTVDEIVIEDGGELYQEDDGHYILV